MQEQIKATSLASRISWVDALKGFGILTVVFLHAHNGYPITKMYSWPIIKWITSFHMALFFACSGYFFSINSPSLSFKDRLKKKVKTLAVPYVVWGIFVGFFVEHGRQLIRKGSLQNFGSELFRILTGQSSYLASWFIAVLIGIYCIEYALLFCLKKKERKLLPLTVCNLTLLAAGYFLKDFYAAGFFRISLVLTSCFFFTLGILLREAMEKLKDISHKSRLFLTLAALLLGGLCCALNKKVTYSRQEYGNLLLHTVSAVLTIGGLSMLFEEWYRFAAGKRLKKALEFFGRNSIIVLLTHLILLYGFRVLEIVLKMEIHTFPTILSFAIMVSAECMIVRFFPKKLLWTFGK